MDSGGLPWPLDCAGLSVALWRVWWRSSVGMCWAWGALCCTVALCVDSFPVGLSDAPWLSLSIRKTFPFEWENLNPRTSQEIDNLHDVNNMIGISPIIIEDNPHIEVQ